MSMNVMMNRRKRSREASAPAEKQTLARLEFEMALEMSEAGDRSWTDLVRQAAQATGGDLLFVLPAADEAGGTAEAAMVRLVEENGDRFLQVRPADTGFKFRDEAEIDPDLLGFARTSIDVLERLRADQRVLEPLSATAH